MASTDPLLGVDLLFPDDVGSYGGFTIRVKGDGRTQALDGNGKGTMYRNKVDAQYGIDHPFVPPVYPVLSSISPTTFVAGGSNATLTATGTGFVSGAKIAFNGAPVTTTFVSATSLTTLAPVSSAVLGSVAVTVQQGGVETATKTLTYT